MRNWLGILFIVGMLCNPANSLHFSFTTGWTGTLTLHFDKDTNLTKHPIHLNISAGTAINNAWGGVPAAIHVTQKGSTVTFQVGKDWNGQDVRVKKTLPVTFSFSPTHADFVISHVQIGKEIAPKGEHSKPFAALQPLTHEMAHPVAAGAHAHPQPIVMPPVPAPPAHGPIHFTPYVDITLNSVTQWHKDNMAPVLLPHMLSQAGVRSARLAFITEQGGQLVWAAYPLDFAKKVVQQLVEKGYKISISLGGATGVFPGEHDKDISTITQKFEQIHQLYPQSDFCFDIETPSMQTNLPQLRKIMEAFKALQDKYHKKLVLTLTVLPSGLDLGVNAVQAAHDAGLDFKVNLMAMDYGSIFADQPMASHAISAAQHVAQYLRALPRFSSLTQAQALRLIELTPMIGYNDTAPLVHTFEDTKILTHWAIKNGVDLSYWSLTRDFPPPSHAHGKKEVSFEHSGFDDQTKDFEFAHMIIEEIKKYKSSA